jgi:hypothetical protein
VGDGTEETEDGTECGDESRLEALRFGWGEAYEITATEGLWRARRLDAIGGVIEAVDPDGLDLAIKEDHAVRPVARDGGARR